MNRKSILVALAALGACTGQVGEASDLSVGSDSAGFDASFDGGGDATLPDTDAAVGPDAAEPDGADADVTAEVIVPLGPLVPTIEPGLGFGRTELIDEPTTIAADLGGDRLVAASASEVWLLDGESATMLGAPPAGVLGAVSLAGATLIATETVLTVEDEGALVESPLHAAVGAAPVKWMFQPTSGPEALWLVTDTTLWWWNDGWLTELDPIGLGDTTLAAAWGADYGGQRALWLGGSDEIYAVHPDGAGWQATLERSDITPDTLVADAEGTLWVLDDSNALHRRTAQGQWRQVDLGASVNYIAGHADSDATWFLRADGVLIQHQFGLWRSTAWTDAAPYALGGGTLVVGTATTTDRLAPLGFVKITGVPDGEFQVPVVATVLVDDPSRVDTVSADVDGTPIAVTASAPYQCDLDPSTLTAGNHTLTVVVTYNDGADPVTRTAEFLVGAPLSWVTDIEPIWADSCTPCHHPDTSSHPLHTAQSWRDEIDKILTVVKSGAMPLDPQPKLTPAEIALIEAWMSAGMPN